MHSTGRGERKADCGRGNYNIVKYKGDNEVDIQHEWIEGNIPKLLAEPVDIRHMRIICPTCDTVNIHAKDLGTFDLHCGHGKCTVIGFQEATEEEIKNRFISVATRAMKRLDNIQ